MADNEVIISSVFDIAISELTQSSKKDKYFDDPVSFAKDVLGVDLWSLQQDIAESVKANKRTLVSSCAGVGKSYLAAVLACWWVGTRWDKDCIVVSTAPTYPQVHTNLWEEIRKLHRSAQDRYEKGLSPMKLPGYVTQSDHWKLPSGEEVGFGRKPPDGNMHAFNGIHRRWVLVIIDEAGGIQEDLFTAMDAITTGSGARILAIGNPDDPAMPMQKMWVTEDNNWKKFRISLFWTPTFTEQHKKHHHGCEDPRCKKEHWQQRAIRDLDFPEEAKLKLTTIGTEEQMRKDFGEDSPRYYSKVLGLFPRTSINTLISRTAINKGIDQEIDKTRTGDKPILGVDVARFGPDYTVIYSNINGMLRLVDFWGKSDAVTTANKIHQKAIELGAREVRIDESGVGGGIVDQVIVKADTTYDVIGMRGDGSSPDKLRWINARAFWYDKFRQKLTDGEIDLDPEDSRLQDELTSVMYHFKNRWKALQIESKEDMMHRGAKSPDFADAAVYACADIEDQHSNPFAGLNIGGKIVVDPQLLFGEQFRPTYLGAY